MADNQEQMKAKEREIPVFTVSKNNCILKNIFVLDNPPPISSSSPVLGARNGNHQPELEEILLVGRHPDCNIKLEHPSISRFHLRIHSKPSTRSLFVTDLSSVHGTCVSGKIIEPGVKTELVQGDTLKLGESSRLYRLDWVPISFAYEINDSFVPQLDSLDTVDGVSEGTIDQIYQDENSLPRKNEWGQCLSEKIEGLCLSMQKMATDALMPEDLNHTFPEKDEVENSHLHNKGNEISSSHLCTLDASLTLDEQTKGVKDQDGDSSLNRNHEGLGRQFFEGSGLPIQENEMYHSSPEIYEVENNLSPEMCNKENEISQLNASFTIDGEAKGDGDSLFHRNDEGLGLIESMEDLERPFSDEDLALSMQKMSATIPILPQDEVNISSPEICDKENEFSSSQLCEIEKGTSPKVHIPSAVIQKESQLETTECCEINSEKKVAINIWSRRGKPQSVKIATSRSKAKCARIDTSSLVKPLLVEDCENKSMLLNQYSSPHKNNEIVTPDKENALPNSCLVSSLGSRFDEALKSRSISNTNVSCVDEHDEAFNPDKENMTPNSNLLRSFKNIGSSNLHKQSPLKTAISCVDEDEEVFTSDKENMTPNGNLLKSFKNIGSSNLHKQSSSKTASRSTHLEEITLPTCQQGTVLQELTTTSSALKSHGRSMKQPYALKTEKRVPFLQLPEISTTDNEPASIPSFHAASINYSKCEEVNQSNSWTIVVDTACLLNKKSRRELQLLRGIRGTSLVIPRIVLRELDCMVRRASFLSRMTEASAALQWIKECMASTKWWIHVQSSAEEGRLVPPTPPAASANWFGEDRGAFSVSSIPFSSYTLQEIITPTAADHILDSALYFKQTASRQFVLLSDDVILKIKAMAEGVLCETAKEFRASLINPFSARFLYSDSSPRGPTWSGLDDTVLKEKYYPSPSKKTARSGEGAKGLKLILFHNSNFRQLRA